MNTHENGMKEFGIFLYENREVRGYGLWGGGGGVTSIFSFLTKAHASSFLKHLSKSDGEAYLNGAQVIFNGDYVSAMNFIPSEKIEYRSFSRGDLIC